MPVVKFPYTEAGHLGAQQAEMLGGRMMGGQPGPGGIPGYALGGIAGTQGPEIIRVGEQGPEAIVPLPPNRQTPAFGQSPGPMPTPMPGGGIPRSNQ